MTHSHSRCSLAFDDKRRVKQAVDVNYMDAITGKLRGLHLKTEQAVRNLYLGKDVLAILPTGFGKSRIYQAFSLQKSCENTGAAYTLIIISPLTSVLSKTSSRGFRTAVLSSLSPVELEECSLQIILCSAEEAITKEFTSLLKRDSSKLHQRVCCIVIDGQAQPNFQ